MLISINSELFCTVIGEMTVFITEMHRQQTEKCVVFSCKNVLRIS